MWSNQPDNRMQVSNPVKPRNKLKGRKIMSKIVININTGTIAVFKRSSESKFRRRYYLEAGGSVSIDRADLNATVFEIPYRQEVFTALTHKAAIVQRAKAQMVEIINGS